MPINWLSDATSFGVGDKGYTFDSPTGDMPRLPDVGGGSSAVDPNSIYGAFGSTFQPTFGPVPAAGGATSASPQSVLRSMTGGGGGSPVTGVPDVAGNTGSLSGLTSVGGINDLFIRGVLVVLGVVFVGVGLWMLKPASVLERIRP